MTEERLEEIKDSIILQKMACKGNNKVTELIDEELELYNEVVRLRKALNCKIELCEYLPEDTEVVVLTKNNYDRQQKDIQLELIDYKSRCEKAVEYIEKHSNSFSVLDTISNGTLLNILNGRSDE